MRHRDPEKIREYNQRYYKKNRLKMIKYSAEYQKRHPQAHAVWKKEFNLRTKINVLTHYGGGKCACVRCGYSDLRALTIDHINSRGNEHRRKIRTWNFHYWLKTNNYPLGYQTLCMNCQFIKKAENYEYSKRNLYKFPQICGVR